MITNRIRRNRVMLNAVGGVGNRRKTSLPVEKIRRLVTLLRIVTELLEMIAQKRTPIFRRLWSKLKSSTSPKKQNLSLTWTMSSGRCSRNLLLENLLLLRRTI